MIKSNKEVDIMSEPEELIINYDDERIIQIQQIAKGIYLRNLWYKKEIIDNIYNSLLNTTMYKLYNYKYSTMKKRFKLQNNYSYRKLVVEKLNSHNKKLIIKTNRNLWLYLEYFTDILDYSKCFDINIIERN